MTTEDLIESFIDAGMRAFKRDRRRSADARRLDRHEPVVVGGHEMRYWREFVTYKMAEYIREVLPDCGVEVVLDGNDTTLGVELSDEEQRVLNSKMYVFLKRYGEI